MPQKSSFFDSAPGDERYYPAREFAEYFSQFVGNGIYKGGTVLKVSATGTDANVSIALGHGWINGYKYSVYDAPLTLPIQPATTQDRIDRIVLRLDTSSPVRAVQALVLQGTPASAPTAPNIVRSGDIYDLSLAQVRIKANSSIVLPENITDERLNNAVCGLVTGLIQQADTTTIFNQFQSWLNTKTAEYQQQWQDFLKSVQDEGFATPGYVDNRVLTGGYGVTTNSGNAYSVTPTPAPTALVAGLKVTVKINAANTGNATLNVKGLGAKTIKKANGNTLVAGNLKKDSIYTLVYDGVSAFILQGEGGGGNLQPNQALAGFTFTNDDGDQVGLGDPNLKPENIRAGIEVFKVKGTMDPATPGMVAVSVPIISKPLPALEKIPMYDITLPVGVNMISFTSDMRDGTYYRTDTSVTNNVMGYYVVLINSRNETLGVASVFTSVATTGYLYSYSVNLKELKKSYVCQFLDYTPQMETLDIPSTFATRSMRLVAYVENRAYPPGNTVTTAGRTQGVITYM